MSPEELGSKHPVTPVVSRIQDTHRRIHRDIEALAGFEKLSEIRSIADGLVVLMKEHFSDEEGPEGLFDELVSLRPVIDSQIAFLRGEHVEILQALEDLRTQIREAEAVHHRGGLERREDHIRVSAGAFVQLIHHHERIESRLVAETYYTDEGGTG